MKILVHFRKTALENVKFFVIKYQYVIRGIRSLIKSQIIVIVCGTIVDVFDYFMVIRFYDELKTCIS